MTAYMRLLRHKITRFVLSLSLCLCLVAGVPTTSFAAESPSSWAAEQVNAAIAANLVPQSLQSGYTLPTTRAEFCSLAVILYENVKGEITERSTFTDTNDVNVQKMAAIGVVSGVGDNKFAPNMELTREQAATMLSRLANAIGTPLDQKASTFADNSSVSSWAVESVGQMQATGIMSGVGNNTFAPKSSYTREQSIITIKRLYDYVNAGNNESTGTIKSYKNFPDLPVLETIDPSLSAEWEYESRFDYTTLEYTIFTSTYIGIGSLSKAEEFAKKYSDYLQEKGFNFQSVGDAQITEESDITYTLWSKNYNYKVEVRSAEADGGRISVSIYTYDKPFTVYSGTSIPDFGSFAGVQAVSSNANGNEFAYLYNPSSYSNETLMAYARLLAEFGFTAPGGIYQVLDGKLTLYVRDGVDTMLVVGVGDNGYFMVGSSMDVGSAPETIIPQSPTLAPVTVFSHKWQKDSVGGVQWTMYIRNNTDKQIKYITLSWLCNNAVGDRIYDSITRNGGVNMKYTGPLNAKDTTGLLETNPRFYNHDFKGNIVWDYIIVEFMDGSKIEMNSKNWDYYYDWYE